MTNEKIDEILRTEEELAPSSGFLARVMDRVEAEAAAPPPIPFPWKRAVPGFVVAALVLGWGAVEFVRRGAPAMAQVRITAPHVSTAMARPLEQAAWVVAALGVSLVSWMLVRRAAR